MRIARALDQAAAFAPSAISIGNFDGVHRGHQFLFHKVILEARNHNLAPTVLTFDPHPSRVVAPQRAPKLLTTIDERVALMREAGITQVLVLPFTIEVAHLTPEQFVERVLVDAMKTRVVIVGDNFRFGHKQAGDTASLTALGTRFGFRTHPLTAIAYRGQIVSSSAVRVMLESGQVSRAARMLERAYALEGQVVTGQGIGSKQTVPTLNLSTAAEIVPAAGVYVTRTSNLEGEGEWNSITNIGTRPTFNGHDRSIETFVLGKLESAPERIRIEFLRRVRDERKFENPEALKAQILRDVAGAEGYFRRLDRWVYSR